MSLRTLLLGVAAATFGTAAHAAVFTLAGSLGSTTPFAITAGGNTATFSSPSDPASFIVQSTAGLFSFPVGLVDQNFFPGETLQISFATPVLGAISIPFAITDFGATTDFLSVSINGGAATRVAAAPDRLPLAEPEGVVALVAGAGVRTLTLTAGDPAGDALGFGIGNVSVPEPVSLSLMGAGLLGLAARRRRSSAMFLRALLPAR